jgi:hypothetical protein
MTVLQHFRKSFSPEGKGFPINFSGSLRRGEVKKPLPLYLFNKLSKAGLIEKKRGQSSKKNNSLSFFVSSNFFGSDNFNETLKNSYKKNIKKKESFFQYLFIKNFLASDQSQAPLCPAPSRSEMDAQPLLTKFKGSRDFSREAKQDSFFLPKVKMKRPGLAMEDPNKKKNQTTKKNTLKNFIFEETNLTFFSFTNLKNSTFSSIFSGRINLPFIGNTYTLNQNKIFINYKKPFLCYWLLPFFGLISVLPSVLVTTNSKNSIGVDSIEKSSAMLTLSPSNTKNKSTFLNFNRNVDDSFLGNQVSLSFFDLPSLAPCRRLSPAKVFGMELDPTMEGLGFLKKQSLSNSDTFNTFLSSNKNNNEINKEYSLFLSSISKSSNLNIDKKNNYFRSGKKTSLSKASPLNLYSFETFAEKEQQIWEGQKELAGTKNIRFEDKKMGKYQKSLKLLFLSTLQKEGFPLVLFLSPKPTAWQDGNNKKDLLNNTAARISKHGWKKDDECSINFSNFSLAILNRNIKTRSNLNWYWYNFFLGNHNFGTLNEAFTFPGQGSLAKDLSSASGSKFFFPNKLFYKQEETQVNDFKKTPFFDNVGERFASKKLLSLSHSDWENALKPLPLKSSSLRGSVKKTPCQKEKQQKQTNLLPSDSVYTSKNDALKAYSASKTKNISIPTLSLNIEGLTPIKYLVHKNNSVATVLTNFFSGSENIEIKKEKNMVIAEDFQAENYKKQNREAPPCPGEGFPGKSFMEAPKEKYFIGVVKNKMPALNLNAKQNFNSFFKKSGSPFARKSSAPLNFDPQALRSLASEKSLACPIFFSPISSKKKKNITSKMFCQK